MPMDIASAISAAAAISSQKDRTVRYRELVDDAVDGGECAALLALLDHLLQEEVPQVISRQVVRHFADALARLKPAAKFEEVATGAISKLAAQVVSFEESDYALRQTLFAHLLEAEEYKAAAGYLAGINVETSARAFSDVEKAELYVKIAETYLEDDEAIDAETFVNRASGLMHEVTDWALQLRYRVTLARVLDARRKFLDAALRYYELSQTAQEEVVAEDLLELLGKAVTCAILGNAGPQRSRILGTLSKDERVHNLEQLSQYSTHVQVLLKMYKEQILRRTELTAFEASLMPHQKAVAGDGLTILERAVIEHNMVAASKIYDNIAFDQLGILLEIGAEKAEKVASRMVSEARLLGAINQVDGFLLFERETDVLRDWDGRITSISLAVNSCLEDIAASE